MSKPVTSLAALMLRSEAEDAFFSLADMVLASRIGAAARIKSVTWDCDDLVFIDFDTTRIALQYTSACSALPNCVTLAIGMTPGANAPPAKCCHQLARLLAQRISSLMAVKAVLWHESSRPPTPDVMDDFLFDLIEMQTDIDHTLGQINETKTALEPSVAVAPEGHTILSAFDDEDLHDWTRMTPAPRTGSVWGRRNPEHSGTRTVLEFSRQFAATIRRICTRQAHRPS